MSITINGGSEKQNTWASSIASEWLAKVDAEIATVITRNADGDKLETYQAKLEAGRANMVAGFAKVTAKQVIDLYTARRDLSVAVINQARQ